MDSKLILSKRKRQQEQLIAVHNAAENISNVDRKTADQMRRIARRQRKEITANMREHDITKILTSGETFGFWGLCAVLPLALVACLSALISVSIGGTVGVFCFAITTFGGGAYVSHQCWKLTEVLAMRFYERHIAPSRLERLNSDIKILEKITCAA